MDNKDCWNPSCKITRAAPPPWPPQNNPRAQTGLVPEDLRALASAEQHPTPRQCIRRRPQPHPRAAEFIHPDVGILFLSPRTRGPPAHKAPESMSSSSRAPSHSDSRRTAHFFEMERKERKLLSKNLIRIVKK